MSMSKVKAHQIQKKTRLALPTPPGAYEWHALAVNSDQQHRTGPFRGCQGVLCSCVVSQFYAGGKISACCLVFFRIVVDREVSAR